MHAVQQRDVRVSTLDWLIRTYTVIKRSQFHKNSLPVYFSLALSPFPPITMSFLCFFNSSNSLSHLHTFLFLTQKLPALEPQQLQRIDWKLTVVVVNGRSYTRVSFYQRVEFLHYSFTSISLSFAYQRCLIVICVTRLFLPFSLTVHEWTVEKKKMAVDNGHPFVRRWTRCAGHR